MFAVTQQFGIMYTQMHFPTMLHIKVIPNDNRGHSPFEFIANDSHLVVGNFKAHTFVSKQLFRTVSIPIKLYDRWQCQFHIMQ